MSSNGVPQNPTPHNIATILPKLQDADSDIRYMTLNDLNQMMINGHTTFLSHDYTTCARIVEGLLHTLTDSHGDVQNMAIKCLGPFVNKAPESILAPTIEKVSTIKTDNTIDISIPALAVRAIVVALPHPFPGISRSQKVLEAYTAISKALIPRIIGRVVIPSQNNKASPPPPKGMVQDDLDTGSDSNSLDLLTEVARCYGSMLQDTEVEALQETVMQVLESERCGTVMKKKAVIALSALSHYFGDDLLSKHVGSTIERLRNPHLSSQQRRLYISVYGSLARSIPHKFGPFLVTLAPFVLAPLSQEELEQQREAEAEADGERDAQIEEVREAALISIESFLESCAQDMKAYTREVVDATTRFLKYEPNVADDDDEDMEEDQEDDEFEGEEDFEEETGFEDEDDVSWKVRRCSAKALHALIVNLDTNDPIVYGQVAPALVARFREPEESVRTEVISALGFLITKSGSSSVAKPKPTDGIQSQSRKRRRGYSESFGADFRSQQAIMNGYASPSTPPPIDAATNGLAKLNPDIVKGAAKLLKSSTPATKEGMISLLKSMVLAQQGGLSEHADLVVDPVVDTMNASAGSGSNAASNRLRIECLALLRAIAETHSSRVVQPHLGKLVPVLAAAAKDRYAKVASEAFATIEVFVKAITPPRSAASKSQNRDYLKLIYDVIVDRISAQNTDTEVRQSAVHALGLLIGRTSGNAGSSLLSQQDRFAGQQVLAERLLNELTRLACVRAVDTVAALAQSKKDFKPDFVNDVALELGAQLRKSSRSLRGASLSALRTLTINQASRECMTDDVVSKLVGMVVPLLETEDLHMIGPALVVLAAFAKDKPSSLTSPAVIQGVCAIVRSPLSAAALDALLACVSAIGKSGSGKELMNALLQNAHQGDTDVTGQVIGTLLVSGGSSLDVSLDAFQKELRTQSDEAKRCLALSVLGEAALRMGLGSPLSSDMFILYFSDSSERVQLSAAVALGRAGAGNVKEYLPKILDGMASGKQYLLLHSVKELLQHSSAEDDIRPYTKPLWDNITGSSQGENNKVVGAECLGRLAILDPTAYLPQLQSYLQDPSSTVRGMVISALRYVFADTNDVYDANLQAIIVPMLATMLVDADLENQRLSLSAFNSALHNKPDLVLPHLSDLLPHAMQATVVRPDLIREVAMGPFKHKVDDGLEIRKSAYETLYALLETSAAQKRLDIPAFYERIIAGLADEHEIKILCCLVLGKLLAISPSESSRRLESLAHQFRTILAFKPKETAVKQELEKLNEQNKAVVKVSILFNKTFGNDAGNENRVWRDYYEGMKRDHPTIVKTIDEELKNSS